MMTFYDLTALRLKLGKFISLPSLFYPHSYPYALHKRLGIKHRWCVSAYLPITVAAVLLLSACDNTHHQPEQSQSNANQKDNALLAQSNHTDNQNSSVLDDTMDANPLLEYQGNLEYQEGITTSQHLTQLSTATSADDMNTYSHSDTSQYQFDYERMSRQEVIKHFEQPSPMAANAHLIGELGATLIGDYQGIFPCKNCDSIKVTLNLYADGSVLKTSVRQSNDHTPPPIILSGRYTQNHDIISLVFNNNEAINTSKQTKTERYLIDDNQLILLNEGQTNFDSSTEGFDKSIDPAYTSNYILSRY